jgi:hypothetical protein
MMGAAYMYNYANTSLALSCRSHRHGHDHQHDSKGLRICPPRDIDWSSRTGHPRDFLQVTVGTDFDRMDYEKPKMREIGQWKWAAEFQIFDEGGQSRKCL